MPSFCWSTVNSAGAPHEILQESSTKKAAWLSEAQRVFPLGSRVKVIESDEDSYVGQMAIVQGYDLGETGCWPMVILHGADDPWRDGFYEDEIEAQGGTA